MIIMSIIIDIVEIIFKFIISLINMKEKKNKSPKLDQTLKVILRKMKEIEIRYPKKIVKYLRFWTFLAKPFIRSNKNCKYQYKRPSSLQDYQMKSIS